MLVVLHLCNKIMVYGYALLCCAKVLYNTIIIHIRFMFVVLLLEKNCMYTINLFILECFRLAQLQLLVYYFLIPEHVGGQMLVSFCCLDLYLWMASSLLSLCGSILCKGSGICLLSSSFTAVKSSLEGFIYFCNIFYKKLEPCGK